jgi:rod shape-determining protein MreD
VVRSQRDTPHIPVQRRAPVKLAAEEVRRAIPGATVLRVAARPFLLLIAVILQLGVVNRLPLPGGTGPDLVLLVVCAIAVTAGPLAGTLSGFAGGLALDVAPPAAHYVGEYALVFCLVGYLAGWVRAAMEDATGERDPWTTLAVMGAAAAVGEAGKAGIGLLLSDPSVTHPAVSRVLPAAILYDLLLSPLVLWLVSRAALTERPEHAPRPEFTPTQHSAGVFRHASAGAAANLQLAGSGGIQKQQSLPRRVPKLHLSDASSPLSSRTSAAFPSQAKPHVAGARTPRLNFSGDHPRTGPRQLRSPAKGWLRARATLRQWDGGSLSAIRRGPSSGWIKAGATLKHRDGVPGSALPVVRRPSTGWIRVRPALKLRGASATIAPAGRRGPAKGWLRPAKPPAPARRRTPGHGWLRTAKPPRPNWYTKGPSTRWLRRSRAGVLTRTLRTLRGKQKGTRW